MRWRTLALGALVGTLGCTVENTADRRPTPEPAASVAPVSTSPAPSAPEEEPSMAKPPRRHGQPQPYSGPVSEQFPDVVVDVRTSFAHDRGVVPEVRSVAVAGKKSSLDAALADLVVQRGGWTAAGGRSEEEARRTVEAWELAWLDLLGTDYYLQEGAAGWSPGVPRGPAPALHPPRATLHTVTGGERVVAFAYWHRYDAGTHGRRLAREVRAYRVRDGVVHRVETSPEELGAAAADDLPRPHDDR